jgi:hypothetical protein
MWTISYIEHSYLSGVWKRFIVEMDTTTIHVIMRLEFICAHNTNNMLWVQFIYNGAHGSGGGGGGGGSLRKMDTCPTNFLKEKWPHVKNFPKTNMSQRKRKQMWKGAGKEMIDMMRKIRKRW